MSVVERFKFALKAFRMQVDVSDCSHPLIGFTLPEWRASQRVEVFARGDWSRTLSASFSHSPATGTGPG